MTGRLAFLICACLLLHDSSARGAGELPKALLRDTDLFPSELFPGLDELDESELLLDSLSRHFPQRIIAHKPPEPLPSAGEPTVQSDGGGVTYVRVRNLASALPAIGQSLSAKVALLDLRYVSAPVRSSLDLASTLAGRSRLTLEIVGDYGERSGLGDTDRLTIESDTSPPHTAIVLVLTNGDTSGPLEAVLSDLQSAGRIVAIGMPTAGHTATYRSLPGYPEWYAISGEIRSETAGSLVGRGFTPSIEVDATPDEDSAGYRGFVPGHPLSAILEQAVEKERFDEARLQREFSTNPHPPSPIGEDEAAPGNDDTPIADDPVLRHAFFIIEGLRALGHLDAD